MKLNELLRESQFSSLTDLQAANLIMQKKDVKLADSECFYTWKGLNLLFPDLIPAIKGNILKAIDQSKATNSWEVVGFLNDIMTQLDSGVHFNNDLVLLGIQKLVTLNIVSQTTADKFKALGIKNQSLSDIHGLGVVGDTAVANARQHNLTIDWWVGKLDQVIEQLYGGQITTKTEIINLMSN